MDSRTLGEQMLPCCGSCMYADETSGDVLISGCENGVDYAVRHQDGYVLITTESGTQLAVDQTEYYTETLRFAQKIETFYAQCSPKILPQNELERNGYLAFWKEWRRRMRGNHYDK